MQLAGKLLAGALGNSALPSQHGAVCRWRETWVGGRGRGVLWPPSWPLEMAVLRKDSHEPAGQKTSQLCLLSELSRIWLPCLQLQDGLGTVLSKGGKLELILLTTPTKPTSREGIRHFLRMNQVDICSVLSPSPQPAGRRCGLGRGCTAPDPKPRRERHGPPAGDKEKPECEVS